MLTPHEQVAIEEWLYTPLQARQLAEIIDLAVKGIVIDPGRVVDVSEWIPWIDRKLRTPDGRTDLLECKHVLEGGDWSLNLGAGLIRKKKGSDINEKRSRGWLRQMREVAHHAASQNPLREVTVDPLRRWVDAHQLFPDKSSRWGRIFMHRSFQFTGERRKSEYITNNAREVKVWRSLRGDP